VKSELVMMCPGIKENLKSFLEDLLTEQQYRAFLSHLDNCKRCREYVRSVGSLSNQIWKLGEIKVPADFKDTVIFKLTHPEPKIKVSLFSKKTIAGIAVFALIVLTFFLWFYYSRSASELSDVSKIRDVRTKKEDITASSENGFFQKEFEPIVIRVEPPAGKGDVREEQGAASKEEDITATGNILAVSETQSLHWHFCYSQKIEKLAPLSALIEEDVVALQKSFKKVKTLETELERLEYQKAQTENKIQSFGPIEKGELAQDRNRIEADLKRITAALETARAGAKKLEERKRKTERKLRELLEQKKAEEARRKTALLTALVNSGIRLDYNAEGLLVFTASGKAIEDALEKIMLICDDGPLMRDFTQDVSVASDKKQRVSIYLEAEENSFIHWHLSLLPDQQKEQVLDMVREKGGSISYELDNLVVISIQKEKLKELKARILAAKIGFSAFGVPEQKRLISKPIGISLYFSQ